MNFKIKSLLTVNVQKIFSRINSGNIFLKRRFSELEELIKNIDSRISTAEVQNHQMDYEL